MASSTCRTGGDSSNVLYLFMISVENPVPFELLDSAALL
jgi:hypothetical protein